MSTFEEDLLADAEDDRRTVEFIRQYLPQEQKEKFSDEEIFYFLDVIAEYYTDLIERTGDEEEVDIDIDAVAAHIAQQAKKDRMGDFDPEDLRWVVDGELEYADQQEG